MRGKCSIAHRLQIIWNNLIHSVWFVSPLNVLVVPIFCFPFFRHALASSRAVKTFRAVKVIACDAVMTTFVFPVVEKMR